MNPVEAAKALAEVASRLASVAAALVADAEERSQAAGKTLNADEAGAMLGINRRAVYELHRVGKLRSVPNLGKRRLRFCEEDVLALRRGTN